MRVTRTTLAVAAIALAIGIGTPAHAELGVSDDGDSVVIVSVAGHSLVGECHWYGTASDTGTVAEFYGFVQADATGIGVTIRCWLEKTGTNTILSNTDMRQGLPGSTGAVQRQITIPDDTPTDVCVYVKALYLDTSFLQYRTPMCTQLS